MSSSAKVRVLVVDDEESIRRMLRLCLDGAGYAVTQAASGEAGVLAAKRSPPDVALVDMRLGGADGLEVARQLKLEAPETKVIVMTAYATIDNAVEAMRAGAVDYLPKPFTPAQVQHVVSKVLSTASMEHELTEMRRSVGGRVGARFDTRTPAMQEMLSIAARVAVTDATVLVQGETGTGKGLLARHIHALSPRHGRPFVTVNCAVVSAGLIENELFGHARGAFTGADTARAGHVEVAGSGTLFLDEVGDLPREVQGKLLRLLEEREYVRVGDTDARRSDARVIAATHRDLKAEVAKGGFREDLFYRLNVVTLRVPPLRERGPDIPDLCRGVLDDLCRQHHRAPLAIAPDVLSALSAYAWPGNLRELVNMLERAVILASGGVFTPDLLPEEIRAQPAPLSSQQAGAEDERLEAAERRHVAAVLARHPTLDSAARALGIDPSTLYRKRDRYGLR
jgi:two-component system, NtrC family, response regulator AlgB